jgi:esterase/lipase superfamily enzyme
MERRHVPLHPEGLGLLAYGHYGRPLLAFPSERGHAHDYEDMGMVDAIAGLLEAGRVKLYCVDTIDGQTWHDESLPLEERARRHGAYEAWIVGTVVPFIHDDVGGAQEIAVTGPSFGAYHAANFALKRADLFPLAICQSGSTTSRRSAGASAATPSTSTTPPTTSSTCTATTSTGCAAG